MKIRLISIFLLVSIILISGLSGCNPKDTTNLILAYPELSNEHYLQTPLEKDLDDSRIMWGKECDGQPGNNTLFYSHNPHPFVIGGNWVEKSVVDCGKYYWIEEFHDWGPAYYGPFDKS